MQLLITILWVAALPFSLGSTCTASGALSWPPVGFSPSPSPGGVDCSDPNTSIVDCCASVAGNDPAALQACLTAGGLGPDPGPNEKLKKRATLTCSSSETCYQYIDGSLLCLDKSTGLYHDDVGGTGNYNTGEYTAPDGTVKTDLAGDPATPSASRTSTRPVGATATRPVGAGGATTTSTTTPQSTDDTNTRASTSGSGSIASATVASVTTSSKTAGATGFYAGAGAGAVAVAGALGVVVGLVL